MGEPDPPFTAICEGLGLTVQGQAGQSLYEALRAAGVPVGSACRGEGVCGRCGVQVLEGTLPPPGPLEEESLRRNRVAPGLRLSCLLHPRGRLRVGTPYW